MNEEDKLSELTKEAIGFGRAAILKELTEYILMLSVSGEIDAVRTKAFALWIEARLPARHVVAQP